MKKLTLIIVMCLLAALTKAQTQDRMRIICSAGDTSGTIAYDFAGKYGVEIRNPYGTMNHYLRIVSTESCRLTLVHELFVPGIIWEKPRINAKGDSIVVVFRTPTVLYLKAFVRTINGLIEIGHHEHALPAGSAFLDFIAIQTPDGLALTEKYAMPTNIQSGAFIRYNGSGATNITLMNSTCDCYQAIISDKDHHYFFYTTPTGVEIERRNNDMTMSNPLPYTVNGVPNPVITDVKMYGDTIIAVETINTGMTSLTRNLVDLHSPVYANYSAVLVLQQYIASSYYLDQGIFVTPDITMFGRVLVRSAYTLSGTLIPIATATFQDKYYNFHSFKFSNDRSIWYADYHDTTAPDYRAINFLLMNNISFTRVDSVYSDDSLNYCSGVFKINDSTLLAIGASISPGPLGIKNAKYLYIHIPYTPPFPTEVSTSPVTNKEEVVLFPNPATETATLRTPLPVIRWDLSDMTGDPVMSSVKEGSTETTIDLSKIESGLYILRAQLSDGALIKQKLIKL